MEGAFRFGFRKAEASHIALTGIRQIDEATLLPHSRDVYDLKSWELESGQRKAEASHVALTGIRQIDEAALLPHSRDVYDPKSWELKSGS